MKEVYVFRGPAHRVQLRIYDWTTEDTPAHLREARPKFNVYVLPASAHPSAAFAVAGSQAYYGDDPDAAWDAMQRFVPRLLDAVPHKLRRYMVKWTSATS